MKRNNDTAKVIGDTGLRRLSDMWLDDFHTRSTPAGGNTERWWNIVINYQSLRGDEIIPGVVRDQEEKIIQAGRSQEYLAALADIVNRSSSPANNDYDNAVLVLTATAEERAEALRKVLEG